MSSSFFCWRTIVVTSASSARLLMPRISSARWTVQVAIAALLLSIYGDEIGQVVLALFVRGANRVECGEQRGEVERVDAGIDFGNRLLRGGGVALLDDLRDLPAGADDAAVAEGPGKFAVITVAAAAASGCVASSAFTESTRSNGASPDSSTTVPFAFQDGRVCSSAWPVPSCCSCVTNWRRVRFASDRFTSPAPWPTTIVMLRAAVRRRSSDRAR